MRSYPRGIFNYAIRNGMDMGIVNAATGIYDDLLAELRDAVEDVISTVAMTAPSVCWIWRRNTAAAKTDEAANAQQAERRSWDVKSARNTRW